MGGGRGGEEEEVVVLLVVVVAVGLPVVAKSKGVVFFIEVFCGGRFRSFIRWRSGKFT